MVLMFIRLRREPQAVDENIFAVKALPSAGIIPLLQMFCPNKTLNEHGFPIFPESRTDQLLNNLTIILHHVDKNHGKVSWMLQNDDIKELADNKSYNERTIKDFLLADIWKDPSNFTQFMVKNLSIPENITEEFLNSTVNGSEVMRMVFESLYPESKDRPNKTKALLEHTFFSPLALQNISCNMTKFSTLIQMPNSPENQETIQGHLCNMSDQQLSEFSREIYHQLNMTTVYEKLSQRFDNPKGSPGLEEYQKEIVSLRKNVCIKLFVLIFKLTFVKESLLRK